MTIVKSKLLAQLSYNYPNIYKKDLEKFSDIILKEIKDALKTREDQLLRLQGAIEGLRLATQKEGEEAPAPTKPAKVK